jgi:small subunit ribosomal protein S2
MRPMADMEQVSTMAPGEELFKEPELKAMVEAGLFFGRKRTKTHPRMKQFIAANRNEMEIIDLDATKRMMERAKEALKAIVAKGGVPLILGTQPGVKKQARAFAESLGLPFVVERWLGGTITNYKVLALRVEHLKKLMETREKGGFEKYTKKERLNVDREIEGLLETVGGLQVLTGLPHAIVMIDPMVHLTAVREATRSKLPIFTLMNTDSDPDMVSYGVVGNTASRMGIDWFFGEIGKAITEGMAEREKAKAEKEQAKKSEA